MAEWWASVDRTFLFLLALPFLVAAAGFLRYRWDKRREKRRQSITMGSALFLFWLLLSGSTEPFLVGAGAASAGAVVWVGHRMAVIDHEGHPIHLSASAFTYLPWLLKEIVKSAWDVSKIIVNPRLPVSPRMVRVPTSQQTAVGVVTYANSITLTPGTISMEVADGSIVVHALTGEGADSLAEGFMDRRVTRFEGAA